MLKDGLAENMAMYAKEQCSIPAGTGKYIPVQTNREIHGNVLVEANNRTVTGLILPEIVYNARKKLGCIFIENHNSVSLDLQCGRTDYRVCNFMRSEARGARSTTRDA